MDRADVALLLSQIEESGAKTTAVAKSRSLALAAHGVNRRANPIAHREHPSGAHHCGVRTMRLAARGAQERSDRP
jgi:hypothetical protein